MAGTLLANDARDVDYRILLATIQQVVAIDQTPHNTAGVILKR